MSQSSDLKIETVNNMRKMTAFRSVLIDIWLFQGENEAVYR